MVFQPLATRSDVDDVASRSIVLVNSLLVEASINRVRSDELNRKRFARLLEDSSAVELTMALTDEVMRISSLHQAARIFRRRAKSAKLSGLGLFDFLGINCASLASFIVPTVVMRIVHARIRKAADGIILSAENVHLRRHIQKRTIQGVSSNINLLGEAVLGNLEASKRLNSIIELVRRPEIDFISVKISSIVSQIVSIDDDGSVDRAIRQLRLLYRQARENNVFVTLDMEEFRDLRITVDAFKKVLSEREFETLEAGIVLQAYLPESHAAFAELLEWANRRHERSGARIKIRLVKGANLAMEKAEAEIHSWTPAPYPTKADVDASYARLIDAALRPETTQSVRIGVASHNLFAVAWAIEVACARGVQGALDIEMLEGMANAEALAIVKKTGRVILYTPVTRYEEFPAAVAYLVRRLDENTSSENYLRASFDIENSHVKFAEQQKRFLISLKDRHLISTQSRRHNAMLINEHEAYMEGVFCNQSDSDPTEPTLAGRLSKALTSEYAVLDVHIPLVIGGEEIFSQEIEVGIDPNNNGAAWYRYCVAQQMQIDSAVNMARGAASDWDSMGALARGAILEKAAQIMQADRVETIAVMSRDCGKVFSEADPEISEAIDFARYYALSAREKEHGSTALGVVLVAPPWNFPYAIAAGGIFAALASGNTVILKPAPESVATAWHLVQQIWEAGVSKSVLQFLPTRDDEDGRSLITHSGIDVTILTGSFETALMFTSWRPDMQLMAETSGKNSILISDKADIDVAVKDLIQSAFGHAGQKCSAASVAIVVSDVMENPSFLQQLKDAVESLEVGSSARFETSIGPIIHPPEGQLLHALTILEVGESWLVQPRQLDAKGYIWSPGVKLGVKAESWSHHHEWFGPVLAIMTAPDFETALAWQNAGEFGLTSGIHSLDVKECETWIDHIQSGNLYVNRGITGAIVERQPFGGWKKSSVGATSKAGGPNYLNNLRNWQPMFSIDESLHSSKKWWDEVGCQAIDRAGLHVERNYQRYRPYLKGIEICVDEDRHEDIFDYINWVSELVGTHIRWNFTGDRFSDCAKVRWLSRREPPTAELLARGISIDRRPIAARGDIECPRWLLEQSVAITNHRYGNIGAGPRPQL